MDRSQQPDPAACPTGCNTTCHTSDPSLPQGRAATACACPMHARRRLGGALLGSGALALAAGLGLGLGLGLAAGPARAEDDECRRSNLTKLISAEQVEQEAGQQYRMLLQQAQSQRALAPADNGQLQRLRYIAKRIIAYTTACNPRAQQWRWDVNLIGSNELNAFCMPGGKICFYYGILSKLRLDDDEVATIMGHEVAHALLEHARERMGKNMATRGAIELGAALFGLGQVGRAGADIGAKLLTLRFSRDDESEADALGLLMSARAGYRPEAGVTLWRKMMDASRGAPPEFLSTHPSGDSRIREIEARMARVQPEYERAAKPDRRFGPPGAA